MNSGYRKLYRFLEIIQNLWLQKQYHFRLDSTWFVLKEVEGEKEGRAIAAQNAGSEHNAPGSPKRPMLEQFEEEVLNAPTRKAFARGLKWLDENWYQNEQARSLTNSMQSLTPTRDDKDVDAGIFFGKATKGIELVETPITKKMNIDEIFEKIKTIEKSFDERSRVRLLKLLDELLSEMRTGFDKEKEGRNDAKELTRKQRKDKISENLVFEKQKAKKFTQAPLFPTKTEGDPDA